MTSFAIGKWARGDRIPRRQMLAQISAATDGQVSPAAFYELPPRRRSASGGAAPPCL